MKLILAFALPEEVVPAAFPGWDVTTVVTGISKPYAAARLARAIADHRPDLVINVGSSGSSRMVKPSVEVGDILVCDTFIDRDLQRQQFTSVKPQVSTVTPFSKGFPSEVASLGGQVAKTFAANTGDDFVTADTPFDGQVVDMESFADALVCQTFGVPFFAVKYVTDIIGENSMEIWEERLAHAREALTEYFTRCSLPVTI